VDAELKVLCLSTAVHPVGVRLERAMNGIDGIEVEPADSIDTAFAALAAGEADLLAAPADQVHVARQRLEAMDMEVVGALQRKHPFHVMVADDRIDYLRKDAIVLTESRLLRRQMRRRRRGLAIRSFIAFAETEDLTLPDGELQRFEWLEGLRESGAIDAYIVPRTLYESAGSRNRRHALTADPEDRGVARFMPVPFADLSVLVARRGFPRRLISDWSDEEGETSWVAQNRLLEATPAELHDRIGLLVRHRRLSTLLNEADRLHDLFLIDSEIDPEGDVIDDQMRIEIGIELISGNGRRTISVERIQPLDDFTSTIVFLCREWQVYLDESQAPHEESVRLGPARPPFLDP